MKNYLKLILQKSKSLFLILAYPIHKFITKIKLKIMDKKLSELLEMLMAIKHADITDVKMLNDRLHFRYRGGVFYVVKKENSQTKNMGFLKVYHDTKLPNSTLNDITEVDEFEVKIDSSLPYTQIYITNYVDLSNMGNYPPTLINGYMKITEAKYLVEWFPFQFDARMLAKNFEIFPNNS